MNHLKQCQKCMREKPYREFSRCNRIEGGFLHKCKECEKVDRERWKRQTFAACPTDIEQRKRALGIEVDR